MELDQNLAKRLFVDGAFLVFLDVPPGTEFGVDIKCWKTGADFKGVKMIPPGLHYIYFSAVSSFGDVAPRTGFIHDFKKSELVVRRWDKEAEDISEKEVNEDDKERLRANLLNLDKFLAPYPLDTLKKWKSLTNKITGNLAACVSPSSGRIRSALDLISTSKEESNKEGETSIQRRRSRPSTTEEREEILLPNLVPTPGTELRFTPLPEKYYPEGSSPSEITRHSLDSSYALDSMLATYESPTDFVGELQLAFICFLVGHSMEAFEHWKKMIGLICRCEKIITKQRELFSDLLTALDVQISEIPEDFLVDIVASNNYVYCSLCDLFRTLESSETVDMRLKTKATRFAEQLTSKFGWDFSHLQEEFGDDAPVIVQM